MTALLAGLVFLGPFILIVGIGVLAVWVYSHAKRKAEEEQRRCAAWAQHRGWTYYPEDRALINRWNLPIFGVGGGRRAENVLTGPVNSHSGKVRQGLSFQYRYTVSTGKSSTTYYFHVMCVFLPHFIPTLTIGPEGFGAKLAKAFGGQDIQFESEDFNKLWRITGDNLSFSHAVVHPQTMEYLMRHAPKNITYYLTGDAILIYTSGQQDINQVDRMSWLITDLIDLVPDFVWQDYAIRR